jgi:NADPH:quinone reductase-like Zn-dependent oxidoreductase
LDGVGCVERGKIRGLVNATRSPRQTAAAQREFPGQGHVGKIVLRP